MKEAFQAIHNKVWNLHKSQSSAVFWKVFKHLDELSGSFKINMGKLWEDNSVELLNGWSVYEFVLQVDMLLLKDPPDKFDPAGQGWDDDDGQSAGPKSTGNGNVFRHISDMFRRPYTVAVKNLLKSVDRQIREHQGKIIKELIRERNMLSWRRAPDPAENGHAM